MMAFWWLVILSLAIVFTNVASVEIYDPLNVFCGSQNCYDILGLSKEASLKDIKKAYRKLSLTHHPDKNPDKANATEVFHQITKAHDVLTGNESRSLFDYYLENPKDYFKVSGQHYYRNLPKSDVRLILIIVVALISWFFHHIQYQKYDKLVKYLKYAILNNLTLKNGGSKQTMDLFARASEVYEEHIKELRKKGDKNVNKSKMLKDPEFEKIVDKMIAELKIEGGYKKPEWNDLFAVRLVLFPYNMYAWSTTYYRRYYSNQPLSMEDKIEMARSTVGYGSWEESTEEERDKFIEMEVWRPGVYEAWTKEREEEEIRKLQQLAAKNKKGKRRNRRQSDDEEFDEDDYIE